jgi:hypothetical protein
LSSSLTRTGPSTSSDTISIIIRKKDWENWGLSALG